MSVRKVAVVSPYRTSGEHVTQTREASALNFVTEALTQHLASDGVDVRIVCPSSARDRRPIWFDGSVSIENVARCVGPFGLFRLFDAVPADRSVIHLEHELYSYGGLLSALTMPLALHLARSRGHKVITTLHGIIPLDQIDRAFLKSYKVPGFPAAVRLVWRTLIREICRASDIVHVHETAFRELLIDRYGVKGRIEVVPLGVSGRVRAREKTASRSLLNLPADAEVVCFFGFLYKRKGILELLESARALLVRNPKLVILIAGSLPDRAGDAGEVRERIAALADCERLIPMGFVSDADVATVLSASDAMILPYTFSMSSSGPLTLAAQYDLPVLLSDKFAPYFPNERDLFEPTPAGIGLAIERFFSDETVRERAASLSRSLLRERDWATISRRISRYYDELAEAS